MKKRIFLMLSVFIYFLVASSSAWAAPKRIGLLIDGSVGAGDSTYNDVCIRGLKMAREKYKQRISTAVYNSGGKSNNYLPTLEQAASASDLLIVASSVYVQCLPQIVNEYPSLDIISFEKTSMKGVKDILFRDNEGGFLAGALAAILTRRSGFSRSNAGGEIGIILGPDKRVSQLFEVGFKAGAHYIDRTTKPISEYIDDYSDPEKGRIAAEKLKGRGADIIFTAAGASGLGALLSANRVNFWVIGVDYEQETLFPDVVLTSIVKRTDYVISAMIERYLKGLLTKNDISVGLTEGALDISLWTREAKQNVPFEVRRRIEEIENELSDKRIVIQPE